MCYATIMTQYCNIKLNPTARGYIDSDQQRPRQLWQSFDQLLGRGRASSTDINASVLHKYFDDKIATVRATTAGADEPTFTAAPFGCELRVFTPLTQTDVIERSAHCLTNSVRLIHFRRSC